MQYGQAFFPLMAANMKSAPGTTFVIGTASPQYASQRFIPQFCYMRLRSMTGPALTTSPGIRIGTNANHDNICPIFIPPTSIVVDRIGLVPLASPLNAPPIDISDIILEITQSAIGPTTMTADCLLTGILVGQ